MRKIILVFITAVMMSSFLAGCNVLDLDRERHVVSNIDVSDGEKYSDRDNVEIVNDDKFSIYLTGTIYDFSKKRNLLLRVENKTNKEISVKVQAATTDEKEQEAVFTLNKIAANEKAISRAIVFKKKTDFKKSSGEIVVCDSNTEEVLGTYKYDVKIVGKE